MTSRADRVSNGRTGSTPALSFARKRPFVERGARWPTDDRFGLRMQPVHRRVWLLPSRGKDMRITTTPHDGEYPLRHDLSGDHRYG